MVLVLQKVAYGPRIYTTSQRMMTHAENDVGLALEHQFLSFLGMGRDGDNHDDTADTCVVLWACATYGRTRRGTDHAVQRLLEAVRTMPAKPTGIVY